MIRLAAALAAVLALAAVPAGAQGTRKVMLRALCFQQVRGIDKVLAVGGGEKPQTVPVDLWTSSISDEVEVAIAGDTLRFAVEAAGADGKPVLETVAEGRAVAGNRQLVLFFPAEEGGRPYRLMVFDDREQSFPMGSTVLLNLAPVAVRFEIGEHRRDLQPGARDSIPLARKVNDMRQCNVVISFAGEDQSWTPVNNTRWSASDQKRDLAIAFVHPLTKQPTVQVYQDTPPWRLPKF